MNYTGVPCPICGQKFNEKDDVVVCPECGTPYHRACYKAEGSCIMDDLHASGKEWINPIKKEPKPVAETTIVECIVCGHPNRSDAQFCEECSAPLLHIRAVKKKEQENSEFNSDENKQNAPFDINELFGYIDPNSTIKKIPVRHIIAFTRKNSLYFVRLFKALSAEIAPTVFNWSALLFGPLYYIYRKMFYPGFLILLLELATYIPSFAVAYHLLPQALSDPLLFQTMNFNVSGLESLIAISNVMGCIPFLLHIYCGFNANSDYYNHTIQTITEICHQYPNDKNAFEKQILKSGGVSLAAVVFVLLGIFALFVIITLVIALSLAPLL